MKKIPIFLVFLCSFFAYSQKTIYGGVYKDSIELNKFSIYLLKNNATFETAFLKFKSSGNSNRFELKLTKQEMKIYKFVEFVLTNEVQVKKIAELSSKEEVYINFKSKNISVKEVKVPEKPINNTEKKPENNLKKPPTPPSGNIFQ